MPAHHAEADIWWLRPSLPTPFSPETLVLEIDGVLLESRASRQAAALGAATALVGAYQHLRWERQDLGQPLFSLTDALLLQQTGCFVDPVELAYALTALGTARLREWKGTPMARRSITEWARYMRRAHLHGISGLDWIHAVTPVTARVDLALVRTVYRLLYWGSNFSRAHTEQPPLELTWQEGLVHQEQMLFAPDLPARLWEAGMQNMVLVTTRDQMETEHALQRLESFCECRWWDAVISADQARKPDPAVLHLALEAVRAPAPQDVVYVGAGAADVDLVRRYRQQRPPAAPQVVLALCVQQAEVAFYRTRGADLLLRSLDAVVPCLHMWHWGTPPRIALSEQENESMEEER